MQETIMKIVELCKDLDLPHIEALRDILWNKQYAMKKEIEQQLNSLLIGE